MAAIDIADCTVTTESVLSGVNLYKVVTPATADDGDTVDVSTVVDETIVSASAQGATDGLITAAVSAAKVVTLPGATDNEARSIYILALG
jgi:hypothetical protein